MRRGWVVLFALAQTGWSIRMMKHEVDQNWDDIMQDVNEAKDAIKNTAMIIQAKSNVQKSDDKLPSLHFQDSAKPKKKADKKAAEASSLTETPDVAYASLVGSMPKVVHRSDEQRRMDAIYTAMSFFAMGLVAFAWLYLRSAVSIDFNDPKAKLRAAAQQRAKEFFAQKAAANNMMTEDEDPDSFCSDDESEATPLSEDEARSSVLDRVHDYEDGVHKKPVAKPDRSVETVEGSVKAKARFFQDKVW